MLIKSRGLYASVHQYADHKHEQQQLADVPKVFFVHGEVYTTGSKGQEFFHAIQSGSVDIR